MGKVRIILRAPSNPDDPVVREGAKERGNEETPRKSLCTGYEYRLHLGLRDDANHLAQAACKTDLRDPAEQPPCPAYVGDEVKDLGVAGAAFGDIFTHYGRVAN